MVVSPSAPSDSPAPAATALGPALEHAEGFDAIFRVVRAAVRRVLGRERVGLGLGLADLPPNLGAFWPVTGNLIVMNDALLRAVQAGASGADYNRFVAVILAHEYLHALGYLDEREVRRVTAQVFAGAFGPDDPVSRLAAGDLWRKYPFLAQVAPVPRRGLRIVSGFDRDATFQYIR